MPVDSSRTFYRYFPVAERDRDWGLFVTTVGESHLGPGTAYPPATHPKKYRFQMPGGRVLQEHQIVYISAGRGWFKSGSSRRSTIEAGTVFLLFPGVWHSYAPDPATGWTEHWIGFNGNLARHLVRNGFFTTGRPVLRSGTEAKMLSLFSDIMASVRANAPALQQQLAGTTLQILARLYSVQQSKFTGEDPGQRIIHRAMERLRASLEQPIDMTELAAELNVSYRWFRRAFTHHTGLSPHHYLLDIRLACARDLLSQSSLSLKEIALRIGFEDPQYFSRIFHKKVGLTPGTWRERAQSKARAGSVE
ncbi:MAG TPA: AraC family transcriptional regulator [Verrucomicrobiae bacterium]|nr:AraC family transcriptional regulator [Verrucomicrobiae bacterium]